MTATNHALNGIAIATIFHKPALALPLALLSHFVTDAIPHSDLKFSEIRVDVIFAGVLTVVLAVVLRSHFSLWLVLGCAFLAAIPDAVWGWRYYKLRDVKKIVQEPLSPLSRWHIKIQWSETRRGIILEAVWFVAVLILIFIKFRGAAS